MIKPDYETAVSQTRYLQDLERWYAIPRCFRDMEASLRDQNILGSPYLNSRRNNDGMKYSYEDGSILLDRTGIRDFIFPDADFDSKELSTIAKNIFSTQRIPESWKFIGKGRDNEAPARVYRFTLNSYSYAAKISSFRALQNRETMDISHGLDFEISRSNRSIMETIPAMYALAAGGIRTPQLYMLSHLISDECTPKTLCEVQFMEFIPGISSHIINLFLLEEFQISTSHKHTVRPHRKILRGIVDDLFNGNILNFGRAYTASQKILEKMVRRIHPKIGDVVDRDCGGNTGSGNNILTGIDIQQKSFEYAIVDLAIEN